MTPAARPRKQKSAKAPSIEPLDIRYTLAELPTSQHRAGLAGLVLTVRWMHEQSAIKDGLCELSELDAEGVVLRIDRRGLEALFDVAYRARKGTTERPTPFKKNKQPVPPLRTVERTRPDAKGKETQKTYYVYEVTVPDGAFLAAWDPSGDGDEGPWIKLWRDMLWQIVRGVPAQRGPFNDRAEGKKNSDASKLFRRLSDPSAGVPQPSTFMLGAQESTADNVPFRDRARFQLLLHFWPLVVQIYRPMSHDRDGKRVDHGYALAIPDIADLELFCEELPPVLRERPLDRSGYLPRAAIVDLAVESALSSMEQRERHLSAREQAKETADLLLGMDVIHAQKQGNNIRILSQARIEPRADLADYRRLREGYWSSVFRAQRIRNYLDEEAWYHGMDRVVALHAWEQTVGASLFRHDAREAFGRMESTSKNGLEQMVLRVVGTYLSRKLASKHQLEWDKVKDDERLKKEYAEKRAGLARDAFLAVRSRTGTDFVEYFTGTLCSVPQHIGEEGYLQLSQELLERPDVARTLTLLALSAKA